MEQYSTNLPATVNLPELCTQLFAGLMGQEEIQQQAQTRLNEIKAADPVGFIYEAIKEAAKEGHHHLVKAALTVEVEHLLQQNSQGTEIFWLQLDSQQRNEIKSFLLTTFNKINSHKSRKPISEIIGQIAKIDVPTNEWPELIPTVLTNLEKKSEYIFIVMKIFERLHDTEYTAWMQSQQLADFYTCIIRIISSSQDKKLVKMAIRALTCGLKLFRNVLENQESFNYMMDLLLEASESQNIKLQKEALYCLDGASYYYYDLLDPHIQTLISKTGHLIAHENFGISEWALEIWGNIVGREYHYLETDADFVSVPGTNLFTKTVYQTLIPVLLERLELATEPDLRSLAQYNPLAKKALHLLSNLLDVILYGADGSILGNIVFPARIVEWLMELETYLENTSQDQPEDEQALQNYYASNSNSEDAGEDEEEEPIIETEIETF
jgi:importin subunit beta-1